MDAKYSKEEYEEIIKKAGEEAEEHIEKMGEEIYKNPHAFWSLKKQILKEKYNIDWKTPQEQDPNLNIN
ncbi:MAG: hypothetical protein RR922_03405 [Clostridia bacterium]